MNLYRNGDIHHGGPAKVSQIFGVIEYVNFRIVCSFMCSVVRRRGGLVNFPTKCEMLILRAMKLVSETFTEII